VKSSRERGKIYDNIRPTHDRIVNKPRDDKYVDINTIINKLFFSPQTRLTRKGNTYSYYFFLQTQKFFLILDIFQAP
jgi:hypothetical protein